MIEVTDRAAADGDICNIDFEGFVDGTPFDGGKADGHELKLGSGQFIPGFEEQIVGKNIGDEFEVNVTFPEDYHAEELKGKPAVFKCKLNGIKFNELPALDDDFACDVSEFNTFDEYKADVKAKIEEQHAKRADAEVDEQLMAALCEKLVCEIPEAMFETETENFVRDFDNKLRMQGLDLATYFKYTGLDLDAMRKQMRPDAERQVKTRLALEKIAALENIEVSDEDVEAELAKIAEAYNMEIEKVRELVAKDAVAEDIKVRKAVELIKEKAVITDAAPAADVADAE
jgi:trigger factor